MPTITLHGRSVEYRLLRTRRNRYVRLTVTLGKGLRVSTPRTFPARDVPRIIHERADWVLEKLDEYERMAREIPRQRLRSGATVLFLGRELTLRVTTAANGSALVHLRGAELEVALPAHVTGEERAERLQDILLQWYRVQAQRLIPLRAERFAALMSVDPTRICVRRQKSRWGSCSARGTINFNLLLVMAPTAVLDYVIVHELAHLLELNHSPRFWRIVERYCPNRRMAQDWLKAHTYVLDL